MMQMISSFLSFIPAMFVMIALAAVVVAAVCGIHILKILGRMFDAAIWLFEKPHRLIIAVLIIAAAAGWWTAHSNGQRATSWERASAAEATAHLETRSRTAAAAISAQLLAEQNRAAVEAQWQAQYQDAQHELANHRRRNADLVTRWLQRSAREADPSGTGAADLPGFAALPEGSVQGSNTAIIPVADLYITADAFAQLDALRAFIASATTVATSPDQDLR